MKIRLLVLMAVMSMLSSLATAKSHLHRLSWDSDPSRNAVIGFSLLPFSHSPYVMYGSDTNEDNWTRIEPQNKYRFGLIKEVAGLESYFVRLTDLTPDSDVFYKVCDNQGCGQRFWFRTAAEDQSPFVAVAGGDTRTGWTNRRAGNRLVAKIRPLFVMHGGDFTNANTAVEMTAFLSDWSLSFSEDVIDGVDYKRIYPMIPTHGNHEDGDFETLCRVFGVDFNLDGQCNEFDTYGAFNVSELLRVYTLNSQFQNDGKSAQAASMNEWLEQDISSEGAEAQWRFAQYHKPMFPHYAGKSDNMTLFNWWADSFYENAMNLVVESDTHINKVTATVRPKGEEMATSRAGTVYVGEGSWGAPARSANYPKSYTIDLASIQQFKVIQVTSDEVVVRTAQFDETATTLTRTDRQDDALALPLSVNWWYGYGIGESLSLVQDSNKRTVLNEEDFEIDDQFDDSALTQVLLNESDLLSFFSKSKSYTVTVPEGAKRLRAMTTSGIGNVNLFVQPVEPLPLVQNLSCWSNNSGTDEECIIENPPAGEWEVSLYRKYFYVGVDLLVEVR